MQFDPSDLNALPDWLTQVLPSHPWQAPLMFAVVVCAGRYLLFAGIMFALARSGRAGRAHDARWPAGRAELPHLRREISQSALTVLIFGAVNAVLFGYGLLQHSQMYWRVSSHGLTWFFASIVGMLLLHDTFFYWLHRAMHSRRLFRWTHLTHHRSVQPTAWAAYSFHPWEALFEALIVTAILFVMPVHPLAFLIFQTISTAYNVYGHSGREFYPPGWSTHPIGRWINTASAHAHHHATGRDNYSLYFLFWDRWMGTLRAPAGP